MLLHEALYKQLTTATLTTQLGSTAIYPLIIPQGVNLPGVTYEQMNEDVSHTMAGDPILSGARFEISSRSSSYKQVKILADSVQDVLRDFSGSLGGSVNVQRIFFETGTEDVEVDPETKKVTYVASQEYLIWNE